MPSNSSLQTADYYANLPINVHPEVTPSSPPKDQPRIGLIGMGAMGRMYAEYLKRAGWCRIHVCDVPEQYEQLKADYAGIPNIFPMKDGHAVARSSDFILYSVEASLIKDVVARFGPSTKMHAIVAGQTSVKAPEKAAFEEYLPEDVHIVSCHSLHGPTTSPMEQPLVIINHRASDDAVKLVESILRALHSRHVYLSYDQHDRVTANTQAVTHAAFLSMGTAWFSAKSIPWKHAYDGIETVKVNLTLRIYSNVWHVYAGIAIFNPAARRQIDRYAASATELFKMMLEGCTGGAEEKRKFRARIAWARKIVFGDMRDEGGADKAKKQRRPILLSEDLLDRFKQPETMCSTNEWAESDPASPSPPKYRPNSHLSLLAMVDCWAHLKINPYDDLNLAATPIFRLFLGVAEYLFLSPNLLSIAIDSALIDTWHRSDDIEFVIAARGWSQCVSFENFDVYRKRFEETRLFLESRFSRANLEVERMIKMIMESKVESKEEERLNSECTLC